MYSRDEIRKIADTSTILDNILRNIGHKIENSILSTLDQIDSATAQLCLERNVKSVTKGYKGFPNYCCMSVNNIACHGTNASYTKPLVSGDVVKIDLAIEKDGYVSDMCRTFFVEEGSQFVTIMYSFNKNLVDYTIDKLNKLLAIRHKEGIPGITALDIAQLISDKVNKSVCYSCIVEYGGHGVGKLLHEDPYIPYDPSLVTQKNYILGEGSVFTIEPIITKRPNKTFLKSGRVKVSMLPDKWSVRTRDICTQYEETVAIINNRIEVLTK